MTAGTANNPWKAWIILTAALLLLQAAIPLADVLNDHLWNVLRRQRIYGYQRSFVGQDYRYGGEDHSLFDGLHYALFNGFLYIAPGLFCVYALKHRLPPNLAVIFLLLNAVLLAAVEGLISDHDRIYRSMTFAFIAMQLCGIVGFIALWFYRGTVQQIEPEEPEL